MKSKRIEGIIYRVYNSKESDKVINLLDKKGSKVSLLVKGVRKPKSRKAHTIDLCNYVTVNTIEGYTVPIANEISLKDEFLHWKKDFEKIVFLQFICEVIDKFSVEDSEDPELFNLLYSILKLKDIKDIRFLGSIFALKLLDITGNLPKLEECIVTFTKLIPGEIFWVNTEVGYVSKEIQTPKEQIPDSVYKTQQFILRNSVENSLKINLAQNEKKQMFKLHLDWLEIILDGRLKSRKVLVNAIN